MTATLLDEATKTRENELGWLHLLSQMEYVGFRKIAKSVRYDRVDRAVRTDPARELQQGVNRIADIEVDHFRALSTSNFQPAWHVIDGQYAPRAAQQGAENGKLPDGAAAEYGNDVTRVDLGKLRCEIPGGEYIGEQDRLFIREMLR